MRYIYLSSRIKISVLLPGALFLLLVQSGAESLFCAVAAAAVHELGHLFAGRLLGYKAEAFTVGLSGADIRYCGVMSYKDDMITALSGPFASAVAALTAAPFFPRFAIYSFAYGALNVLPVGVFDGGRALRALLFNRLPYSAAERAFLLVSFTVLFLLYLAGIFILLYTAFNASLFFVCVYAFAAAVSGSAV